MVPAMMLSLASASAVEASCDSPKLLAEAHHYPSHDLLRHWVGKVYSQDGADGVLHRLFAVLGSGNKEYVEFGTQSGLECNSRFLREHCGWHGLMMDGGFQNSIINLNKEFITRENIVHLFQKYNVSHQMDLLSVDIDGNDFHVLNAILRHGYRPRVIVVEYQSALPAEHDMVLLYEKTHRWDGSCYSSGGILSYSHLGAHYGYTLVGATGPNLYFVRDTVLAAAHATFKHANDPKKLWAVAHGPESTELPSKAAELDAGKKALLERYGKAFRANSERCVETFRQRGFATAASLLV